MCQIPKSDITILNAKVGKIKPLIRFKQSRCKGMKNGTDKLFFIEPPDLIDTSYKWVFLENPKLESPAIDLVQVAHLITYHSCWPDLFRPTIGEVLMQIPDNVIEEKNAVAFEIVEDCLSDKNFIPEKKITWAVTVLYANK